MGLIGAPRAISHFQYTIEIARYVVQSITSIVAIIYLFLPLSGAWFAKNTVK
jgi:hypothetical protein